jgi:hypothetical protein
MFKSRRISSTRPLVSVPRPIDSMETARTERLTFCWKEGQLRELTVDLFISLDGFASGP